MLLELCPHGELARAKSMVQRGEGVDMLQELSAGLTEAVGIAISPFPIIAIILVLLSARAKVNAPFFVVGWVVGLIVTTSIGYFLIGADSSSSSSKGPSDLSLILQLVLGVLFAVLAIVEFRKRGRPGAPAKEPKFFAKLDNLTVYLALGLGLALAVVNAKNLPLALMGGAEMAGAAGSGGGGVAAIVTFALIASSTLILPTLIVLLLGKRVETQLTDTKNWLLRHNSAIMVTLFALLAAKALSDGLALFT